MVRLEGDTLVIREVGEYFQRAAKGLKPNAQLVVGPSLNAALAEARGRLAQVRVYNEEGFEFDRRISDLTWGGSLWGSHGWTVSWYHVDIEPVRGKVRSRPE